MRNNVVGAFLAVSLLAACVSSGAEIPALPEGMQGPWFDEPCLASPGEANVRVSARAVLFEVSRYDLNRISPAARDGAVRAMATIWEEGYEESKNGWISLRLEGPRTLSITTDYAPNDMQHYVRCTD